MQAYQWPGNVRELRNVVERAVYRWAEIERPIERIEFDPFASPWRPMVAEHRAAAADPTPDNPPEPSEHDPAQCVDLRLAVALYEKAILAAALERCRWNQRAAAAALSLTYDQLRHAMKRHALG